MILDVVKLYIWNYIKSNRFKFTRREDPSNYLNLTSYLHFSSDDFAWVLIPSVSSSRFLFSQIDEWESASIGMQRASWGPQWNVLIGMQADETRDTQRRREWHFLPRARRMRVHTGSRAGSVVKSGQGVSLSVEDAIVAQIFKSDSVNQTSAGSYCSKHKGSHSRRAMLCLYSCSRNAWTTKQGT